VGATYNRTVLTPHFYWELIVIFLYLVDFTRLTLGDIYVLLFCFIAFMTASVV
jgi:hypothetical protein